MNSRTQFGRRSILIRAVKPFGINVYPLCEWLCFKSRSQFGTAVAESRTEKESAVWKSTVGREEVRLTDGAKQPTRKTLLVVDDDVEWTDLLRVFFSKKYDVSVANHADQAMDTIVRQSPHVILLDLVMPAVDGFGLMQRMHDVLLVNVPTVLTTGWGSTDVKDCAESLGCVAVLCKPVSLLELDVLVSSLMDGTNPNLLKTDAGDSVNHRRSI